MVILFEFVYSRDTVAFPPPASNPLRSTDETLLLAPRLTVRPSVVRIVIWRAVRLSPVEIASTLSPSEVTISNEVVTVTGKLTAL